MTNEQIATIIDALRQYVRIGELNGSTRDRAIALRTEAAETAQRLRAAPRTPAEGEEAAYDRSKTVPVAWIAFADNGNIRLWTADERRAKDEKSRGLDIRAFTLAELIALVSRLGHAEALVEDARAKAIEEAAALMQRWSDEAGEFKNSPRCELQMNVCRNAATAIRNILKHSSTMLAPEETK